MARHRCREIRPADTLKIWLRLERERERDRFLLGWEPEHRQAESKGNSRAAKGTSQSKARMPVDSKRAIAKKVSKNISREFLKSKGKKQIKRSLLNPIKGESASGPLERERERESTVILIRLIVI